VHLSPEFNEHHIAVQVLNAVQRGMRDDRFHIEETCGLGLAGLKAGLSKPSEKNP